MSVDFVIDLLTDRGQVHHRPCGVRWAVYYWPHQVLDAFATCLTPSPETAIQKTLSPLSPFWRIQSAMTGGYSCLIRVQSRPVLFGILQNGVLIPRAAQSVFAVNTRITEFRVPDFIDHAPLFKRQSGVSDLELPEVGASSPRLGKDELCCGGEGGFCYLYSLQYNRPLHLQHATRAAIYRSTLAATNRV